jgi:choloylglycine hydrolase
MVDGASKMLDGAYEITVYTGGLSTRTNTYYYNTYDNLSIRQVSLSDHDLNSNQLLFSTPI